MAIPGTMEHATLTTFTKVDAWSKNGGSVVARVLRAPVQRHVMGPLVTKQLSNSFAARTGRTMANCQFTQM